MKTRARDPDEKQAVNERGKGEIIQGDRPERPNENLLQIPLSLGILPPSERPMANIELSGGCGGTDKWD